MKKLRITIDNKSYDVTVEDLTEASSYHASALPVPPTPAPSAPSAPAQPAPTATPSRPQLPVDPGAVTSPMAGIIKAVLVKPSDQVKQGQPLVILEAMKMENQITAPAPGSVKSVGVKAGESVNEGHVLVILE